MNCNYFYKLLICLSIYILTTSAKASEKNPRTKPISDIYKANDGKVNPLNHNNNTRNDLTPYPDIKNEKSIRTHETITSSSSLQKKMNENVVIRSNSLLLITSVHVLIHVVPLVVVHLVKSFIDYRKTQASRNALRRGIHSRDESHSTYRATVAPVREDYYSTNRTAFSPDRNDYYSTGRATSTHARDQHYLNNHATLIPVISQSSNVRETVIASNGHNEVATYLTLVTPNSISDPEEICPICLGGMKEEAHRIVMTRCHHLFHNACIMDSVRIDYRCPICRRSLY